MSKCGSNHYSITQEAPSPLQHELTKNREEKVETQTYDESGDSSTRAVGKLSAQKMRLPRKVKTRESKVKKLLEDHKFFKNDILTIIE